MVDKVCPLKIEQAGKGTEVDFGPTEADPTEDYLAAKGIALENSDLILIDASGTEIQFTDPINGTKSVSDLLDAEQEDFDPTGTTLVSTKTGPAVREVEGRVATNETNIDTKITGPASATDNAIIRYDSTTGKLAQNSSATVNDNGGIIAGDLVRPGDTSDTTNANIRYNSNELQGRVNGNWRTLSIVPTVQTSTSIVATSASTYSVVSGMSSTPAAGTYTIIFECNLAIGPDTSGDIAIFVDTTQQSTYTKRVETQSSSASDTITVTMGLTIIIPALTLNGSQVLSVQFKENLAGVLGIANRSITRIPILR